jgi:hypothetical protein
MSVNVDPLSMDVEQERIVLGAVKTVAEYLNDLAGTNDSIKETLDLTIQDLSADKDSAKLVKKYIKATARHYFKQNGDAMKTDNAVVETWLDKLSENVVDRS